jgi:hypothetical protein
MGERKTRILSIHPYGTSKNSFTFRKILRHGTFPIYFPSERKVCCGFLSPLKIHRLSRVLNPQPLVPVASTLTTTPPRRHTRLLIGCFNEALSTGNHVTQIIEWLWLLKCEEYVLRNRLNEDSVLSSLFILAS